MITDGMTAADWMPAPYRPRPWPIRRLRRLGLFLSIVWRVWDVYPDGTLWRLDVRTAWDVACIIWE